MTSRHINKTTVLLIILFAFLISLSILTPKWRRDKNAANLSFTMRNTLGLVLLYTHDHGQLFPSMISMENEQEKLSWRLYCLYTYANIPNPRPQNPNLPDLRQSQNKQAVFDFVNSLSNTSVNQTLGEFYCSSTEFAPLLAVTGKETAFDPDNDIKFKKLPASLIIFISSSNQDIGFRSTVDIAVTKTSNGKVSFYPPRDKDHDFAVMFADGETRVLTKDIPDSVLSQFMTTGSAAEANRKKALEPYTL